jgi:putative acetyltransferase
MEIHIRAGKVTDLPKLLQLQRESLAALSGDVYSPQQIQALIAHQGEARALVEEQLFVAEVEGEIVGFTSIDHHYRQIQAMFVAPNWARQGVGSQLIRHLEDLAKAYGTQRLRVMSSLAAIRFYTAQSYKRVGSTGFKAAHQVWIPCQYMEKLLVPASVPASDVTPVIPTQGRLWGYVLVGLFGMGLLHLWFQQPPQPQETRSPHPAWAD